MRFKNPMPHSPREETILVKNVSPSPNYSGSLIRDWEAFKGKEAIKCACCGKTLTVDDKIGGHVIKTTGITIDYYVVPLCKACNNAKNTKPFSVNEEDLARLLDIRRMLKQK